VTAPELLRDVLVRIVWIRETGELEGEQALKDLELDLAGWLAANEERRAA
jgi:hypothetical protein